MIQQLTEALFPVLSLIVLGAVLGRKTDFFSGPSLSGLVTTVGIPALLLHSVLTMDMNIWGMGEVIVLTLVWLGIMSLVTAGLLAVAGLPVRSYLPALVHPNTGNMGIPVCYALFGPQSLGLAMVISSVIQVSHFTLGIGCLSGKFSFRALIKNGPVLALIAGAILLAAEIRLPSPVMTTLDMLGSITVPVMLMQLGASIANLNLSRVRDMVRPLAFSFYRPLGGLLIAWLLLLVWPLEGMQAQVFMIQCAMPVAVMSYVLAVKYRGPAEDVAVTIPLSLVVSIGIVVGFSLVN
ncbi:AEC family transporter [Marinobacter salinexigens]|uniref:AEC family transporter n=1 Tax=Marinobacter salinexigens TaxID=2919747 RepID=A0A5B0VFM6_9GAMM|nr:AEC family transporter [Marinobacter salinexigens]KAA1172839.1 AEC family transporter [Marinobacter salinexigens]